MILDLTKNWKLFWQEPHLEPGRASTKSFFAKVVKNFLPLFSQIILYIDVWQGSKYTSGTHFVFEIMLAIDDFSSKSWFQWNNYEN